MSDEAKIKRVREMRDLARRTCLNRIDVRTVDLTAIVDENDRLRARVAELEAERDTAREAYAALWVLMDQVAQEERQMTGDEAEWFYTSQPEAIWDALHANGCCRDGACDSSTCMDLPKGETCGTCVYASRCTRMFGAELSDTSCGFFPRRFRRVEADR